MAPIYVPPLCEIIKLRFVSQWKNNDPFYFRIGRKRGLESGYCPLLVFGNRASENKPSAIKIEHWIRPGAIVSLVGPLNVLGSTETGPNSVRSTCGDSGMFGRLLVPRLLRI